MSDFPQAVLEHRADFLEFFGFRMLGSEERTQCIESQQRQADKLRRAIMKVSADSVQKALARLERCASRIDEHRALRFDGLIASPYDAVEQNNLQQRYPANRNPALQAGSVKFGIQASRVGKELRHCDDVIAAFFTNRDIGLQQRHVQCTLKRVSLAVRVAELRGYFAFQRLEQLRIGRESLTDG